MSTKRVRASLFAICLAFSVGLAASSCSTSAKTEAEDRAEQSETQQAEDQVEEKQAAQPAPDIQFQTRPAMYAANEEWLTFACELPDGQVNINSTKAIEMYYYSLYGLGNLVFRSGNGVHQVHNPLFRQHVQNDEGMPWYKNKMGAKLFLQHKLAQFVKRTNAHKLDKQFPPKGAYPIYLEYETGEPTFQSAPELDDFNTLRWNKSNIQRTMNPGGWGQTMLKQVLWSRDFFTNSKVIDGLIYPGNEKDDGANGFRGASLLALSLTKSVALKSELAYNPKTDELGGVDPKTYNPADGPRYYPHQYAVDMKQMGEGMPPKPSFRVTDKRSDLFDVASLLWAQSEFYFITDPKVEDEYDVLFGDPKWDPNQSDEELAELFKNGKAIFPAKKPHMLAQGMTAVNFKNMMGLHFDKKHGTLVDTWAPGEGKGNKISTSYAGIATTALANTHHRLHDVPKLKGGATKILTAQANFLLAQQNDDGSIADGFTLEDGDVMPADSKSLVSQSFAIRAFLSAYHVTKDDKFKEAAEKTYGFMKSELWSDKAKVFRTSAGATQSTYDGVNTGATIGALRELAIVRSGDGRREVVSHLDSFFESVAQKGGLQLAEIGKTGEPIPPLAERKAAKMKMMKLMKEDPEKAKQMKMKMMDMDRDSVPKPGFVAGTEYGAAPVYRASVTLDTE